MFYSSYDDTSCHMRYKIRFVIIVMMTAFQNYHSDCTKYLFESHLHLSYPIFYLKLKSHLQSMLSTSTDEDVLTVHEAAPPNIQQFNPEIPIYNENVDDISCENILPQLSIGDDEKSLKSKGRVRKLEYLKRTSFKTFQTVSIPSQNNSYQNIASGICRIPTLQAMAIVGLRSNLTESENQKPFSLSSVPKKSATFTCGPIGAGPKNKSFSSNTEAIVSSLLVTSSSPNLSPQIFATKCTKLTNISSNSPLLEPDHRSNLILNPVFENHPRPANLSIPVEIVTTSSKG